MVSNDIFNQQVRMHSSNRDKLSQKVTKMWQDGNYVCNFNWNVNSSLSVFSTMFRFQSKEMQLWNKVSFLKSVASVKFCSIISKASRYLYAKNNYFLLFSFPPHGPSFGLSINKLTCKTGMNRNYSVTPKISFKKSSLVHRFIHISITFSLCIRATSQIT